MGEPVVIAPSLETRLLARSSFHTLDPRRDRARTPAELCELLLLPSDDEAIGIALRRGLDAVFEAMLDAFPDNLLWDLEAPASRLLSLSRTQDEGGAEALAWALQRTAALQHTFGRRGPIRFRYIHDFIYGFDWAKWVAKSPESRAAIGPYDLAFVERMHRRGAELIDTIAAGNDEKYRPLTDERERNPFGFSREPEDELRLHRRLAADDALPVEAWRFDAQPRWRRPFGRMRATVADALGA